MLQLDLCFPSDPLKNWGQTDNGGEIPRRLPSQGFRLRRFGAKFCSASDCLSVGLG